ncbi:hypothetical protein [Streptomyces sp. NPDC005141]
MSVTTPLTQFADEERDRAIAAVKAVTAAMVACDAELARRKQAARDATGNLAEVAAEEAGIRRQLALALLPADALDLVEKLESTLIKRQRMVAGAARAEDDLGAQERKRAALATALDTARVALSTATDTATKAHEDADSVDAWTTAARAQPVTDALRTASQTLSSAPYTAARHRLDTLLGTELVDLFKSRWTEADQRKAELCERLARARAARWELLAERGDRQTPSGTLLSTRSAYSAAVAALRAVAEGAPVRVEEALNLLTTVQDGTGPTEAEQARMNELREEAKAAAAKQQEVFTAATVLRKAKAELDEAVLAKVSEEPGIDPKMSEDLNTQRAAVAMALTKLKGKQDALDAAQNALDTWEAAIPEVLKEQVLAFLSADATLGELSEDNLVDTRITAVSTTRAALDTALKAAANAAAASDRLVDEVRSRTGDTDAGRVVATARRAALVRGEA